jgi:AbrB family looped-hinge helix DNA binding protein
MKAVISEKGQVTIPKAIRDRLGLKPGMSIEFRADNGTLIGRKVGPAEDPVLAVTGIVKRTIDVDRYLSDLRGPGE